MKAKAYDLLVFGASGFTGQYVIREILQVVKDVEYHGLRWAVAGRNRKKIEETLRSVEEDTGEDVSKVPILQADVEDQSSLEKMAEQAEVVVNVVGPYRFFGEPVVKACIEKGAHHVDISGEAQFLDRMQVEYHDRALAGKVYVVGACGYDSIPAEMGVVHLRDNFRGDLNGVEQYMRFRHGPEGYVVNAGTWKSAVHGFANAGELAAIHKKLFPTKLPRPSHKLERRPLIHKDPVRGKWSVVFPAPDVSVVRRSQHWFHAVRGDRPVQFRSYMCFGSLLAVLGSVLVATVFGLLAKIPFTRSLLANNPKLFSLGAFSNEGPTKKQIEGAGFMQTLIGTGWSEKLLHSTDQHKEPPNKRMILEVAGPDAGYKATSVCLVQSALAILREKDKLPAEGGVYPPAAAFEKTSVIDGLQKRGVTFTFK